MAKFLVLCAGCVAASGTAALATPINYGNFGGATVDFLGVTEDSSTDPTPLFGAPTTVVDSLVFNPVSFASFSSNGSFDMTDGTMTTMVDARPGFNIPTVNLTEAGDYTLAGAGTPGTWASASLAVHITVYEVNDTAVNAFTQSFTGTFSPNGGFYSLPANAGNAVVWNGSANINVDAIVAAAGYAGQHATRIQITLDNQLITFSEPGTLAHIKKKQAGGVIINVPTPGAFAVIGLGGLVATRRRR
ncbi:MAG: hypothetical protein U0637_12465 [Phycisphaerales bacterium]